MHLLRPRLIAHFRFRAAAYLVLLIALVPTFIVYWRVLTNMHARDEARFLAVTRDAERAVGENLESLAGDLLAVSGFFEATTNARSEEWTAFVAKLELDHRHPGIRSVGFGERVDTSELAAFLERMRKQIDPAYAIFPPPRASMAFPTVYVTQFPTNMNSRLGWDSYSEANRRYAIDSVVRTAQSAVTGKVSFWNNDGNETEGFTVFVPVQRAATNGAAKELKGIVFSSFIPAHLFNTFSNSALAGVVNLELFDGTFAEPSRRLASFGGDDRQQPAFDVSTAIRVLDRTFLLRVTSLPAFARYSEKNLATAVLACSLALSFLLFGITWMQGSARSATEGLNQRLRESEEQLRAANTELERKIAEARQTETMLAHERDLLNTLLEHSPDRIYFKDRDSRFIKCGKSVFAHSGQPEPVEPTGKNDFDFFTEEHARPAFAIEQEIIRTGNPVIGLVEKETWRGGYESWVLTSKLPLRDKHGNIIGTFGISKDISELKAVELALAKEKELLAVTLRSIGDGVITADIAGRIVLFNHVAEQVTGWPQAAAMGRPLTEIFKTTGGESDSEILRRALNDTIVQPSRDAVLLTRSGAERNISQSVAPIMDRDGRKLGAVLVFRDVTEKLQIEAELTKASKLESIGVLAGGIAHDFNNILTVILGNISLARMAQQSGMRTGDSLEEAEKASLRARELTQRLLTFAKGGAPIRKPLSLVPLVRDCAVSALRDMPVTTEFFFGEDLWLVEADESQITQVLHNLIGYARASMSKDPRLDVHVFNQEMASDPLLLLPPGRYVRVSIRDYGAGIQPENAAKIFEPYFGSKKQGSGLELATAYSIVRKHEGQIRVESISGQGTVFHIYLPASQSPPVAVAPTRSESQSRAVITARRVLVMDDELPIRKLAVLLLEKLGCAAVTAEDGAEAIRVYESARANGQPFDVVIMDLTIPNGMGGKETIRQLKAIDPGVLAIVSSGYSNDPVMANFRDHGFAGVVPKPYNSEDLAAAIGELFAESAAN
jgi:PAS domain S-box-containing protein